jgi:hypothetical protein
VVKAGVGTSVLGSLDSQATHLEAVLSLKTMQTEHFTLLGRLTRESGRPVEDKELEVRGAAATEDLDLSAGAPEVASAGGAARATSG